MNYLKKIKRLFLILLACSLIWIVFKDEIKKTDAYLAYSKISSDFIEWKDTPFVTSSIQTFKTGIDSFVQEIDQLFGDKENEQVTEKPLEKLDLEEPTSHLFSINNLELNDTRESVEQNVGNPLRSTLNEYGVNWNTYHDHYRHFFMVAYDDNDKVVGLFTNQDLLSSKNGIRIGSPKEIVLEQFGQPLSALKKGWVSYQIENHDEYHLFQFDDSYITIFYDKHESNTVAAIQIISDELENKKEDFYVEESPLLLEGYEYQLFDLTNAVRVKHGLHPLGWDEEVRETARNHSNDMALNQYFDHTNLDGQSPFDRMKEDDIFFRTAGENLAAGQLSSIYAHEGLMNSLGHRENILQADFELLGIGVAFDKESRPYFTQNFLAK